MRAETTYKAVALLFRSVEEVGYSDLARSASGTLRDVGGVEAGDLRELCSQDFILPAGSDLDHLRVHDDALPQEDCYCSDNDFYPNLITFYLFYPRDSTQPPEGYFSAWVERILN